MRTLALIALIALLAACGPNAVRSSSAEIDSSETWWCVIATGENGFPYLGCATTESSCLENRAKAVKWGRWAKFVEIGECLPVTVEP